MTFLHNRLILHVINMYRSQFLVSGLTVDQKKYGNMIQREEIILCYFNPSKQDTILAELLQIHKEHIVGYHEHDSLLDHKEEEELTEEERKAAWAEYEAEKKVVHLKYFLDFVFMLDI